MKKILLSLAGLVVFLCCTASACSSDKATEPFKDAPRAGSDDSPATVIYMPDGFSNLATKCVNGTRYTSAFKGDHLYGAISVSKPC